MKSVLSQYDMRKQDNLYLWYEQGSDELVCTLFTRENNGRKWIEGIFVNPSYRGRGICNALLDFATFLGADRVSARKSTSVVDIYKKYGFEIYDDDNEFFYLRLKEAQT